MVLPSNFVLRWRVPGRTGSKPADGGLLSIL